MITNIYEAAQQTLEALEKVTKELFVLRDELAEMGARPVTNVHRQRLWDASFKAYTDYALPAAISLRSALAQQGEPVARVMFNDDGRKTDNLIDCDLPVGTLLYAGAAPAAQPDKNELKQLVIRYGLECMANHGTGPSVQAAWQDFIIALG